MHGLFCLVLFCVEYTSPHSITLQEFGANWLCFLAFYKKKSSPNGTLRRVCLDSSLYPDVSS